MRRHPSWGLILLTAGVIIALTVIWPQPLGDDRSSGDAVVRHYDHPDDEQCSEYQRESEEHYCSQLEAPHPSEIA